MTSADNIIEIFTSSEGSSGNQGKSLPRRIAFCTYYRVPRQVLTEAQEAASGITAIRWQLSEVGLLLPQKDGSTISLNTAGLSMGVFEQAISNVAYLRAQVGGGMSRLNFASESISSMETNLRAAIGRIEDVDIAAESANLAKYSILTQAAAAMVAQANSTNDIALMLLR